MCTSEVFLLEYNVEVKVVFFYTYTGDQTYLIKQFTCRDPFGLFFETRYVVWVVVPRGGPDSEALNLRDRRVVGGAVDPQGVATGICGAKVSDEETGVSIVNT